jgi:hypothetical protein
MNIRDNVLNPVLTLHSPNKTLLAILLNNTIKLAYEIVKKLTLNDVATLTFKIPFDNTVISYDSAEMLVKFENDFYIIKTVELSDDTVRTLIITCESEFTELKGIKCQALDLIGKSPQELFDAIMVSPKNVILTGLYKLAGTDISSDTFRAVQTEDEVSVFENLLTMCQKFNCWMEFSTDSQGQKWIFFRKNAINNGKFLRKGQGLKSLDITYDSTGIFTRMYGYGANDPDTGNPINIISVNPTGKAYVEDISWFISKGMTKDEIYAVPRCVQETDYTSNDITDKNDLLRTTQEELAKVCVPTLSGKINISDFSILEDTAITKPMLGEQIIVIDQDVNFDLTAQIQTIERKYSENPYDVEIEISNVIKYDSVFKDLQNSSDTVKTITSINNGVPVVNSNYVQGILNALNASFIGTVDLNTPLDKQSTISILFEDRRVGYQTFGAIGFGTKGLCIANELNTDGTWNWQTFGTAKGFNADLIKTGTLKTHDGNISIDLVNNSFNFLNKLYSDNDLISIPTQPLNTNDKQIASTEFVINQINTRQNIIIDTVSTTITAGTGSVNLTITGLGINPPIVINGDYSINTAQVIGVKNINQDIITVFYINAIAGQCKLNFTYTK